MPFGSKRQLQTCFGRQLSLRAQGKTNSWDCKKWLSKTADAECLPDLVASLRSSTPKTHDKCRKRPRSSGPELTQYYRGLRGGLYFYADGVRVYVPADAKEYVEKNNKVVSAERDPFAKLYNKK